MNRSEAKQTILALNRRNDLDAFSYEKLDVGVDATVKSLTVPAGATYAEIGAESSNTTTIPMRYLMLGNVTPPTSSDGLELRDGTRFDIIGYQNLINFRVIRTGADTDVLHIQYYK